MSSAQRPLPSFADLPEPIREELWGVEKLEQHAAILAGGLGTRLRSVVAAWPWHIAQGHQLRR